MALSLTSKWNVWLLKRAASLAMVTLSLAAYSDNALQDYLAKEDPAYHWEVKDTFSSDGVSVHDLYLRSQQWTGGTWTHQLTVVVPDEMKDTKHCLLFITGGRNEISQPRWSRANDRTLQSIGAVAKGSGSPVAIIRQVPNQPLYGNRFEDDLISFTFDRFLATGDKEWPLLFPMVKSAVKAMDAVQAYTYKELSLDVQKFVVAGGSKRGWTTWLTGASDPRVAAIGPMVIDTLNFDVQMDYQLDAWGKYSYQIEDYTRLGLQERMKTEKGKLLNSMVDPYAYRDKVTMPKLIFIGTNDPYWPVDAVKHYFDDLTGEKYIHYVPNAGHDLGDGKQAIQALAAFFAETANGTPHPAVDWKVKKVTDDPLMDDYIQLTVNGSDGLVEGKLWSAVSDDRDFRDNKWESETLSKTGRRPVVTGKAVLPESGYKAFYVDLVYPSPIQDTYTKSTRMYVVNSDGIIDEQRITMN